MKHLLSVLFFMLASITVNAQQPFKGKFYNDEHEIYIVINLYDKNVTVPGQEIYGEMDGYVGSKRTSLVWMITGSELLSDKKAKIELINDYGSEDADAELVIIDENTIEYTKKSGANLRFSKNGKWVRMPGKIVFKKK